jgi:hypothetical protein
MPVQKNKSVCGSGVSSYEGSKSPSGAGEKKHQEVKQIARRATGEIKRVLPKTKAQPRTRTCAWQSHVAASGAGSRLVSQRATLRGSVTLPKAPAKTRAQQAQVHVAFLRTFLTKWRRDMRGIKDDVSVKLLDAHLRRLTTVQRALLLTDVARLLDAQEEAKRVHQLFEDMFSTDKTPAEAKQRFAQYGKAMDHANKLEQLVREARQKREELLLKRSPASAVR